MVLPRAARAWETRSAPVRSPKPSDAPTITLRFSAHEVLRHQDVAAYSSSELDECHRLMADLRLAGALRPARRLVKSKRDRGRLDLRHEGIGVGGPPDRLGTEERDVGRTE